MQRLILAVAVLCAGCANPHADEMSQLERNKHPGFSRPAVNAALVPQG
jgi:hypothetical protein